MEIWDILDENGNKIGKTMQRGESLPEGFYHLGVDVWIMSLGPAGCLKINKIIVGVGVLDDPSSKKLLKQKILLKKFESIGKFV